MACAPSKKMTTSKASLPATSLIICTRNRPAMLRDTLCSVLAGSHVPSEIVVVDQSPTLTPIDIDASSRGCEIRQVPSATTGLCRARNIAIAKASHDLLAFIDDDMYVAPDWFEVLMRALAESGPDTVITGKVLPAQEQGRDGFVPSLVLSETPQVYRGRFERDVLAAGHMAMHRSTYQAVGPFDETLGSGSRFPASDDNDYGYRLAQAGYGIRYAPEAVIYHRAWRKSNDYWQMRWSYGRGKGGYYAKHLDWRDRYMLKRMVSDVTLRVVRFPWRFIHRPRLALGDVPYVAGVLSGAAEWLMTQPRAR
jgi:GT2 family glycosyltransferase